MLPIERYAYCNSLRGMHPGEKFLFAVASMTTCLALNSLTVSGIVLLLMAGVTVRKGRIPLYFYIKLLSIPLFFFMAGTITIAINVIHSSDQVLWSWQWANLRFGITVESLLACAKLFLRSMATVSCLYFLSLTTPLIEIISILRKLKIPELFLELMSLIYRYLFILLEMAEKIYTSQSARQGYTCIKNSYRSMGLLASSLLMRSHQRSLDIYTSLEARGYNGTIKVLEQRYQLSKRNLLLIAGTELFLISVHYLNGGNL
ncbi:cobalt/nickel transport system permease protein [Desulforamulus putei DSM 12395]|uniref:Cobalt/nickel transport system permease protein n=1 Tax=Desulforamulus putei DSM 12395 TaxID=1121429 RepID=A0A1M4T6Z3_9FIRM|nr:cobalt ECF transporter T component CbiQ [Desulforamulus putei]SHE40293.1 cobalt/nickel transport system permease protein [Desulforamulus putei DSM 12395]